MMIIHETHLCYFILFKSCCSIGTNGNTLKASDTDFQLKSNTMSSSAKTKECGN